MGYCPPAVVTCRPNALLDCAIEGTTAGTGFGQLQVAGTVGLAGTLVVTFTNGFVPATNNSFPVVTADALSGVFANFELSLQRGQHAGELHS